MASEPRDLDHVPSRSLRGVYLAHDSRLFPLDEVLRIGTWN